MSRSTASSRSFGRESIRHPSFEPCDLYVRGHLVHPTQARKAWESDEPVSWGRFAGIDEGLAVVRFLDRVERFRCHRPQEIAALAEVGDKARFSHRWGVLSLHRRFEHVITVSIADVDAPWTPCSMEPLEPEPLDALRLEERGGSLVPGPDTLLPLDAELEPDGA
jgi:hypothetical protein